MVCTKEIESFKSGRVLRTSRKLSYEEDQSLLDDSDMDADYNPSEEVSSEECSPSSTGSSKFFSESGKMKSKAERKDVNVRKRNERIVEAPSQRCVERREKMKVAAEKGKEKNCVFEPNDEDLEFENQVYIIGMNMNSKKNIQLHYDIPPEVLELIQSGSKVTGTNKKYTVGSGSKYRSGIRKEMGFLQEKYKKIAPHKLDENGHIHYENFLAFNSPKWIKPSDPEEFCDKVLSPGLKCAMLAGHMKLVDHLLVLAGSPEGIAKFTDLSNIPEGLTEEEKAQAIVDEESKGEEKALKYQHFLTTLIQKTQSKKLFRKYHALAEGLAKKRTTDADTFDGKCVPDPNVVVPLFLESDWCEEQEELLIRCALKLEKPTKAMWSNFNQFIPVRWASSLGNRPESLGNMTVEDWIVREKCSENPHYKGKPGEENNLNGYKIERFFHKTPDMPLLIYIDEINEFLGRCYHQVRVELFGQPKSTDAFFVSVEGHQLITNGRGIPLRMWDKITNYPGSTSYLFRDMFINYIFALKDISLRDGARFAATHSKAVQEKHYVTELSKKLKALLVLDTYKQGVSYQVEGDLGKLELSSEAKSKEIAARYEIFKSKTKRRLAWQKKMDDSKSLTVDKSVNESTKVSFLNSLILEAELNLKVNPEGRMLDLFLLKRRSDPSKCTRYIMQALDKLPMDDDSILKLHDHLFQYCGLVGYDENEEVGSDEWYEKIERNWAVKLINQLGYLSRNNTDNPRVKHIFATLVLKTGSFKYCLGSEGLERQVKAYIDKAETFKKELKQAGSVAAQSPIEILSVFQGMKRSKKSDEDASNEVNLNMSTVKPGIEENLEESNDDSQDEEEVAEVVEEVIESISPFETVWEFDNVIIRQKSLSPVKITKVKKVRASKMTNEEKRKLLERIIDNMRDHFVNRNKRGQQYLREDVWEPFYSSGPEKRSLEGLEMLMWRTGYPNDNKKGLQDLIKEVVGLDQAQVETVRALKDNILAEFDK